MFIAIARKLNLENCRDIPLRHCGTSSYSLEIAEAFITGWGVLALKLKNLCNFLRDQGL